jgi:Tfp pilus assembly protein PilE
MDQRSPAEEDLYRVAVGENKADYYVPLFQRFDAGGSHVSWNWPAFFVTFLWLLYRRMYGYALIYFFALPFALATFGALIFVALGKTAGGIGYLITVIAVPWIAVPMFVNALYHLHVKSRIEKAWVGAPSPEAVLQRLIGQRSTANGWVIAAIAGFVGIFVIGILAAISIPAYQDYTVRAQVAEGLTLAAPVKVAVARAYADTGEWPADLQAADLDATDYQGKYVESVEITDGMILIHYGNTANALIAGSTLSLRPAAAAGGEIVWNCGYAGSFEATPTVGTDIAAKHLPSSCRGARR